MAMAAFTTVGTYHLQPRIGKNACILLANLIHLIASAGPKSSNVHMGDLTHITAHRPTLTQQDLRAVVD
jgi:hypothetical protein